MRPRYCRTTSRQTFVLTTDPTAISPAGLSSIILLLAYCLHAGFTSLFVTPWWSGVETYVFERSKLSPLKRVVPIWPWNATAHARGNAITLTCCLTTSSARLHLSWTSSTGHAYGAQRSVGESRLHQPRWPGPAPQSFQRRRWTVGEETLLWPPEFE